MCDELCGTSVYGSDQDQVDQSRTSMARLGLVLGLGIVSWVVNFSASAHQGFKANPATRGLNTPGHQKHELRQLQSGVGPVRSVVTPDIGQAAVADHAQDVQTGNK